MSKIAYTTVQIQVEYKVITLKPLERFIVRHIGFRT